LKTGEEERNKHDDYSTEIGLAVEKLVKERLGALEDAMLLGNKLYKKPTSEEAELYLRDKAIPNIRARIALEKSDMELGESVHLEIELQNVGKAPVLLERVEEIIPNGFELVAHSDTCDIANTSLEMHGRKLSPYETLNLGVTLRATGKGSYVIAPRISFMCETGRRISCKPEPASISVSETILPGRVGTGFHDLDSLLFGGIPQNYAVVLTSASCDERDLLIRRYLEAGLKQNDVTFYVTIDATGVRNLAEEHQSNFYVFLCNPKLDKAFENLPNVSKLGGVESLTEINITLESMLRRLNESKGHTRRACVEILSDVLLQHHAVQTRRWLGGLISGLRSRDFTTLAVLNPHMHAPEETHAVVDMFEGEISIYEKEKQTDMTKYLRIKKMYNQRYLESELPLRKTRLMTTPLTLPCCTRTPNV
jgi:KaiC/GvpD/RAD55 family RecA-like ATPase